MCSKIILCLRAREWDGMEALCEGSTLPSALSHQPWLLYAKNNFVSEAREIVQGKRRLCLYKLQFSQPQTPHSPPGITWCLEVPCAALGMAQRPHASTTGLSWVIPKQPSLSSTTFFDQQLCWPKIARKGPHLPPETGLLSTLGNPNECIDIYVLFLIDSHSSKAYLLQKKKPF